jgi:predicted DNA-binding WGR domain protein
MGAVHLIRIDPARNMRRFYRLDAQPDLFGGFVVVREWGRIGARAGRMVGEWHMTEAMAGAAMQRQADSQAPARLFLLGMSFSPPLAPQPQKGVLR